MPSRICCVPLDWTMEDYDRHSCADGSHTHISFSQYNEHRERHLVAVLRAPGGKRVKGVVKIQMLAQRDDRWAGKPSLSHASGEHAGAGLSARVGEYLAMRFRQAKASRGQQHEWAVVMMSDISTQPIRQEEVPLDPSSQIEPRNKSRLRLNAQASQN